MSITVEDGTGLTTSDAYISVADADAYHTAHGDPAAWSGAATADKEAAIRLATQYLDLVHGRRWRGRRTNEGQALDWPRSGVRDRDGFAIESNEIPARLEDACAELALRQINGDTLIPDIAADSVGIRSESVGAGPVRYAVEYAGTKRVFKSYSVVRDLLRGLTASPGVSAERG